MTTAWHQQYCKLIKRGLIDPDPRQQFTTDLRKFLLKIKSQGSVYSLNWDANTAHNDDEIVDLLQDTDMTDIFDDYFFNCPPTHQRGSTQIDLCHLSSSISNYIQFTFILPLDYREGNHSYAGYDLDLAAMISSPNLESIDPLHAQNRILISTDIKASTKYLQLL